ncbi:hypothetical protein PV327_003331 [Microctonus hyperodae]|uniref:Uncharacterized protein n=1 Tax=Microctonus hyperodae TaxID=165561 RepID=A0AA39G5E3_MICHY|nr:hypothetical protein PV327_003331 [Microctonus hyperodae]
MKAIIVIETLAILALINFALSLALPKSFNEVIFTEINPNVNRAETMESLKSLDTNGLIDTMSVGNFLQSRLQKRSGARRKIGSELGKAIGNALKESMNFVQTPDLKDAKKYLNDDDNYSKITGYQLGKVTHAIYSGKFADMLQKKKIIK